jgi:serine/threonine-protein phosphatase 2A activator
MDLFTDYARYLHLIRRLILTYTLEPAGSHGVWGLDDHSFLPYLFGSAQYSPAISSPAEILTEGSFPDAPRPGDVTKQLTIERERKTNMYFSAIGFIYDVKKGPFWEHSPILYDISGVTAGWAKINKGMIKMYNAEVLGKFPVVQHFPFGSLFKWEKNPEAPAVLATTHSNNQPSRTMAPGGQSSATTMRVPAQDAGTKAPWATAPRSAALPGPKSSWTGQANAPGMPATRAPWASATGRPALPGGPGVGTAAPWSTSSTASRPVAAVAASIPSATTAVPWARTAPDKKDIPPVEEQPEK